LIEERIKTLGIELPDPPAPAGSYVPAVRTGDLVYISGQIPIRDGRVAYAGCVTDDNIAEAQESARMCAIGILAQAKRELGSLDRVARIVRLSGFVSSAPGFSQHPKVINAASDLMEEVFGQKGRHSRIAVGVAGLPLGAMTEIDAIIEVVRE
jgi:enamine deaminase RidA (YjgF/YER057c/UK114 family)